jgi:hypothetical protein
MRTRVFKFVLAFVLALLVSTAFLPSFAFAATEEGSSTVSTYTDKEKPETTFAKQTVTLKSKKSGENSTYGGVGSLGYAESWLSYTVNIFGVRQARGTSQTTANNAGWFVSVSGRFYKQGIEQQNGGNGGNGQTNWRSNEVGGSIGEIFREAGSHYVNAGAGNDAYGETVAQGAMPG